MLEMVRGDKVHRPDQKRDRRGDNGERKGKADKNEMREVEHRGKGQTGRIFTASSYLWNKAIL